MGLFLNMPMCELGEQKYYTCTGCVQTFIHNSSWCPKLGASVDFMHRLSPLVHLALVP